MKLLTKPQLIIINTLVSKLGIRKEVKQQMVIGFSYGRETSTTQLTGEEATAFIQHLKSIDPGERMNEEKAERMRRKIISMAHEINWRIPGTTKVNMLKVDAWCIKYSPQKKKLNHHKVNELAGLVTQFEKGPYSSYIRTL